ncbi:hypothetical protein DFH08DRAFT_827598 [Mycena albidolilacea]|uniref:Uncharacterized protein n=1 Tax=Mycena albidolilacea TaxID=1033008 RepID=A0AAD7E7R9_9AGAR|nr:hypothetical protein DFH08DRAFT_827598 [Mycena albidolilacea]
MSDASGDLIGDVGMPLTLTTVFLKLAIKDNFVAHPICFVCHEFFDVGSPSRTFCPDCNQEIFGGPADHFKASDDSQMDSDNPTDNRKSSNVSLKQKPSIVAPIQLLSAGLRDFFQRPGMIEAVNSWKKQTHVPGQMKSMQDADVWKTLKDSNKHSLSLDAAQRTRYALVGGLSTGNAKERETTRVQKINLDQLRAKWEQMG